jgi:hypothetical protein
MRFGPSQVGKADLRGLCGTKPLMPAARKTSQSLGSKRKKGRQADPFSLFFCSLSDWPTSWGRRYCGFSGPSTGFLQIVTGTIIEKMPRLFKGARPVDREEVTKPGANLRPGKIRLAQRG